jgi:MazG family protein
VLFGFTLLTGFFLMTSHLEQFIETIARLRGDNGCPWDKAQTHDSLARYLLEEAYEVLEAIHLGDAQKLKEELGDLLLQIVLNAQIASDNGEFEIQDVAQSINEKMIRRHPHVFADATAKDAQAVVAQWDELKAKEAKDKGGKTEATLDNIPKTMPALLQALKVSEKAVAQGFEWENIDEVWDKLYSELVELRDAMEKQDGSASDKRDIDLELGDVLFCLVNLARWQKLNAEESLLLALDKFKQRFHKMEKASKRPLKELTKQQWQDLWLAAKNELA